MSNWITYTDTHKTEGDDTTRLATVTPINPVGQSTTRPYTDSENAGADQRALDATRSINKEALLSKAEQALSTNATFLAIASPTNAQTLAQVKALTKQINALIKLAVNDLNSQDGT